MSEVKRFKWDPIGMRNVERFGFFRSTTGTWVDASDYDAKASECERLREENARLRKALLRIADKNAWDEVMELKNMAHAALSAVPMENGHE